ncbi:MAG: hypothetical protein QXN08_01215 [Nitrososphaerales archaeon]
MLYARVKITDLNNKTRVVGSEGCSFELRLHQGGASTFRLIVNDSNGFYREAYGVGSIVNVYCDSVNPPLQHIYQGQVEEVAVNYSGGRRLLVIDAAEYAYILMLNRYVVESYHDKTIDFIVRDLFSKYAPEVDTSGVQETDKKVGSLVFNYVSLKECLDQLAELAHYQYVFTPNLKLHFYPKGSRRSDLTLTSSNIIQPIEVLESIREMRNIVHAIGGYELKVDQSQTITEGYTTLESGHYAAKFTPTGDKLRMIALFLEKQGVPTEPISGQIVQDLDGKPRGQKIDYFTITPSDVGEEGYPSWVAIPLQSDVEAGKQYWITLAKCGTETSTYRWYHNNSNEDIHAYSSDGEEWIVVDGSWTPAYKQFYGVPVLAQAVDENSVKKYGRREFIYVNTNIIDKATVKTLALNLLTEKVSRRFILENLMVKGLSKIPQVGDAARVVIPELHIDCELTVKSVVIEYNAGASAIDYMKMELG